MTSKRTWPRSHGSFLDSVLFLQLFDVPMGSHACLHPHTATLMKTLPTEADAAVHAEVPSGPSVELAQKMPNGNVGPASNPGQPVGGNLSGVPARVKLPVAAIIHDTVNTMSRDLQSQLRKQSYNFERADKVLADLGVRISRKNQPKRGKHNNTTPKGQKRSTEGTAAPQEEAVANKRTRTDPQGSEATPSQANAEAAVAEAAAGNAQAESLLHVPTTSLIPQGAANPTPLPTDQTPADLAPESLPPAPLSGPTANAPASQTSLAAAAAAAMGGPSVSNTHTALTPGTDEPGATQPASNAPSHAPAAAQTTPVSSTAQSGLSGGTQTTHTSAQQPKPPMGNFSSDRGVFHLNGNASSRRQPADGESLKLYDVKRGKHEASAMHVDVPLKPEEKKTIDFKGKLYLAPLTTVGNLPFRRICKGLGADITCGEMALATNLLQGQGSEWALLKRHPCEDMFGVQVCGGYADALTRTAQLIEENCDVNFVDVNMGCPIDLICSKGAGSSLLQKPRAIGQIVQGMSAVLSCPLTIKVRKGFNDNQDVTHTFLPEVRSWGACAVTLHGRSRQQRYSRAADWEYVTNCARQVPELPLIGNGDVFSWTDYQAHINADSPVATAMIARGALMKPWIFQEIKEQRHMDISASERLDLLKHFCSNGLEHWGSDAKGVETTRRFLLEWLSFLYRYVPVGLLEVVPQCMQWRPPAFFGRSDLETLLASDNAADWVRISEMLLGPTPANFSFAPKHRSNAYARSETEMAQDHEAEEENG
ncbi:TPA: hypothetical protein ACH3X1_011348 [Trebouxia sp. C0004]